MPRARVPAASLVIVGLLAVWAAGEASALGRPDWAKPFLTLPTPSGSYIAKSDAWVVVYGEIAFALRGERSIETRCRLILENITSGEEPFVMQLAYDEGAQELSDLSLDVERALWHSINLDRKAARASFSEGPQILLASAERIESHKRVVLQYTISDRLGVTPWGVAFVPRGEPICRTRFSIEVGSAARGLRLDLVTPSGADPPPGFARDADGSWVVSSVPALSRIRSRYLVYQPAWTDLYPYFLAAVATEAGSSFHEFAVFYRTLWDKRSGEIDGAQVKERADVLTRGTGSLDEKAARLARFVQHEIQYDGSRARSANSWAPIGTQETLRAMKADCKGKALLAQALLHAIGVESTPVLLRSDTEYFSWGSQIGTALINHVILAVDLRSVATPYPATLRDGPAKGWVLFDPTLETADFGEPLPGYEGVPALYVGDDPRPVFTIRTRVPSVAHTRIEVQATLDDAGHLRCQLHATDNGSSALVTRLALNRSDDEVGRELLDALGQRLPDVRLVDCSRTRAGYSGARVTELEFSYESSRPLQRMSRESLLESPLAVVAVVAGLPPGFTAAAPAKPEDVVTLEPPWDAKLNTNGFHTVVDATFSLTLPASLGFTPPKPRHEARPWMTFDLAWTQDGPHRWKGELHLESPRGAWPREERKERVVLVDERLTDLYAPLLLDSAGSV